MASPEGKAAAVAVAEAALKASSHPSDDIQYHITLWLSLSLGVLFLAVAFHFLTNFERDDPVLYSQVNINTHQKNK